MTAERSLIHPATIQAPTRLSSVSYVEKRSEPRYQTNDPATVQILPIDETRRPAVVLNVSRSGLKLGLHAPIPKGIEVKICLPERVVVFAEVRYCQRIEGLYHAGVLIHDVIHLGLPPWRHISEGELGLYVVGKGLATTEILNLREHLMQCDSCRTRLNDLDETLNLHRSTSSLRA